MIPRGKKGRVLATIALVALAGAAALAQRGFDGLRESRRSDCRETCGTSRSTTASTTARTRDR
jgi:hypothetical protein